MFLTDRDEMSNLYRGSSIDAPTKFQFIRSRGFKGEDFFLEIDQSETRIAYGGHFLNGSARNVQSL